MAFYSRTVLEKGHRQKPTFVLGCPANFCVAESLSFVAHGSYRKRHQSYEKGQGVRISESLEQLWRQDCNRSRTLPFPTGLGGTPRFEGGRKSVYAYPSPLGKLCVRINSPANSAIIHSH